jgi:hypothetical protein
VKKMTEMMKTIPATMATHAAARKTRGVLNGAASTAAGAGAGAVAVEVRTVGVSDVSLMRQMMQALTIVAAMRYLCSSYEPKNRFLAGVFG